VVLPVTLLVFAQRAYTGRGEIGLIPALAAALTALVCAIVLVGGGILMRAERAALLRALRSVHEHAARPAAIRRIRCYFGLEPDCAPAKSFHYNDRIHAALVLLDAELYSEVEDLWALIPDRVLPDVVRAWQAGVLAHCRLAAGDPADGRSRLKSAPRSAMPPELEAYLSALDAYLLCREGRPHEALAIVGAADGPPSPIARYWVLTVRAHAFAVLVDTERALAALRQLRDECGDAGIQFLRETAPATLPFLHRMAQGAPDAPYR
jgi:hypothetical protein